MKALLNRFFFGTSLNDNKTLNTGWLLFRLHLGLSIAIHAGWPKMNTLAAPDWFNDQVAGLGFTFPSPAFWATIAAWGEFAGGICVALGLLTRFNALQLAFQFLVISFLWYDNPEPITGMYFQNTLLMGFVLVVIAGGGSYSLDKLIRQRKSVKRMMPVKIAAVCLLCLFSMAGHTQTISAGDFKNLAGNWKGQLTYLDYSSNKPESIPVSAGVKLKGRNLFVLSFYYSEEASHNEKQKFRIKGKGTRLNTWKLTERTMQTDGTLKVVLESTGKDGNDGKPAIFHHELLISSSRFTITKRVRFEGEKEFFQRNQYQFTR